MLKRAATTILAKAQARTFGFSRVIKNYVNRKGITKHPENFNTSRYYERIGYLRRKDRIIQALKRNKKKIFVILGCGVIVYVQQMYIQVLSAAMERTYMKYKKVKNMKKFPDSVEYRSALETDVSVFFADVKLSNASIELLSDYFKERDKAEPNGYTLELVLEDLKKAQLINEFDHIETPEENTCSMKDYLELVARIVHKTENWPAQELNIVQKITHP